MRESSAGRVARLSAFAAFAALAAALATTLPARADIIHLADGRKLEGEVKLEGDTYVITSGSGIKTRVPKYMVRMIEKADPPAERVAKARKALEAKGAKATADEWAEVGKLAAKFRLKEDARRAFEKAISIDRDHEAARNGLGQVYDGGGWVSREEAMIRQGKVKVDGRWVDKEDVDAARGGRSDAAARPKIDEAKAMAKAGNPSYVKCENCNGSGISVWIPCKQCDNSGKPGYSNLGDRYALCMRCKGAGRLPGIRCAQCRGRGKYDPKKPRTPKGRYISSGFKVCPTCNGTGVEAYTKCLQCARSNYPGFCYFGERYEICRKCGGTTKIPTRRCAPCQGSGLVRVKR